MKLSAHENRLPESANINGTQARPPPVLTCHPASEILHMNQAGAFLLFILCLAKAVLRISTGLLRNMFLKTKLSTRRR